MKKTQTTPEQPEFQKQQSEQEYPPYILSANTGNEEQEDENENPMAYTLLSKINDPYYRSKSPQKQSLHDDGISFIKLAQN